VWKKHGVWHCSFLPRAKLRSRLLNLVALQTKTFQSKTFPATMTKTCRHLKKMSQLHFPSQSSCEFFENMIEVSPRNAQGASSYQAE